MRSRSWSAIRAAADRCSRRVFRRLEIPAAVEASAPLAGTAVGRSLVALCRAVADDDPAELLAHLRADPSTPPAIADKLELGLRRDRPETLAEAIGHWQHPPLHLTKVRAAAPGGRADAGAGRGGEGARRAATRGAARRLPVSRQRRRYPLRSGRAARRGRPAAELCAELAEIGVLPGCEPPDLAEAADAIESATVRLWRGPAEGRVRILDPYRIRAGRARHLFCAGLQEGEFPRRSAGDPLLGDDRRATLGIAELAAPRCPRRGALPVPRLRLAPDRAPLSLLAGGRRRRRTGGALAVRRRDPRPARPGLRDRRRAAHHQDGLERVVFARHEAPTVRELARAEALAGPRVEERSRGRSPCRRCWPSSATAICSARARSRAGSSARTAGSSSTSSRRSGSNPRATRCWLGCRRPRRARAPLRRPARRRRHPPPRRPRPLARAARRAARRASPASTGCAPSARLDAIALARLRAQIERLPRGGGRKRDRAAAAPRPARGRLRVRGRGRCAGAARARGGSRCAAGSTASTSRRTGRRWSATTRPAARSPGAADRESRGKLQLQLYMLAARERLGLDPIGGLYTALGARNDRRPRGILIVRATRGSRASSRSAATPATPRSSTPSSSGRARRRREKAAAMRAGSIDRDPIGGRCPTLLHVPADLPARARARARGRLQRRQPARQRGRPMSELYARRPSSARRSTPATATSSARPAPAPARRGCWSTATATRSSSTASASTRSSPSRSPSAPRPSCGPAIRRELDRARRAAPRARRGRARRRGSTRAARETERAWVTTIHGFCRRLLATHPAAAGIDPRFRVLAESEASRLRRQARDDAVESRSPARDHAVRST